MTESAPNSSMSSRSSEPDQQRASLDTAISNLLEETRIFIPGSQTLFGFQLIVVFNQSFQSRLSATEQALHLVATVLTAIAIALLMAPAAYHRQVEPESISRHFLLLATRFLTFGSIPIAIAICIELYLVGQLAVGRQWLSLVIAIALGVFFAALWYVMPRRRRADP